VIAHTLRFERNMPTEMPHEKMVVHRKKNFGARERWSGSPFLSSTTETDTAVNIAQHALEMQDQQGTSLECQV
jgi:hypothetical protein